MYIYMMFEKKVNTVDEMEINIMDEIGKKVAMFIIFISLLLLFSWYL